MVSVTSGVEHLFTCLLAVCESSSVNRLFMSFARPQIAFYRRVLRVLYILCVLVLYQVRGLKIFSPSL